MDPQNFETRRDLVSVCPVCGFGDCRSPERVDVTPPRGTSQVSGKVGPESSHQTA